MKDLGAKELVFATLLQMLRVCKRAITPPLRNF
jgi:hypothetical protein